jgi:DivIVA domain-containing protein
MTPDEVHNATFRKPRIGNRGYNEQQVDDVLDRLEATLRGHRLITREEIDRLEFGKPPFGRRGYREQEVDEFLRRASAEWPAWC